MMRFRLIACICTSLAMRFAPAMFYSVDGTSRELIEIDQEGVCRVIGPIIEPTLNVSELCWAENQIYGIGFNASGTFLVRINPATGALTNLIQLSAITPFTRTEAMAWNGSDFYIAYAVNPTFGDSNQWSILNRNTGFMTLLAPTTIDMDGAGYGNGLFYSCDNDVVTRRNKIYSGTTVPDTLRADYSFDPNGITAAEMEVQEGRIFLGAINPTPTIATNPSYFQELSVATCLPLPRVQLSRPGNYRGIAANPNPGRLSGNITLQDLSISPSNITVTVQIRDVSAVNVLYQKTLKPSGSGDFSFIIPASIGSGAYTVSVDGDTWIRETSSPITITSSGASGLTFSLQNGDCDGDGEVGPGDFEIIVSNFGNSNVPSTQGDLDRDEEVGPSDFEAVVRNFGEFDQ